MEEIKVIPIIHIQQQLILHTPNNHLIVLGNLQTIDTSLQLKPMVEGVVELETEMKETED